MSGQFSGYVFLGDEQQKAYRSKGLIRDDEAIAVIADTHVVVNLLTNERVRVIKRGELFESTPYTKKTQILHD